MTLSNLLDQVEANHKPLAANLITEMNFIRQQLVKLRREIREDGCTELFVQGKQKLTRLTPSFQAYNTLIARYAQLHRQLIKLVPGSLDEGDEFDAFLKELA